MTQGASYLYQIIGLCEDETSKRVQGIQVSIITGDVPYERTVPSAEFLPEDLAYLSFRVRICSLLYIYNLPPPLQSRIHSSIDRWVGNWLRENPISGSGVE